MKNLLLFCFLFVCFGCTTTIVELPPDDKPTTGDIVFRLDGKQYRMQGKAIVLATGFDVENVAITGKNGFNETISIIWRKGGNASVSMVVNNSTYSYALCPSNLGFPVPSVDIKNNNTAAKTIEGAFSGQLCNTPTKSSNITEGTFLLQYD